MDIAAGAEATALTAEKPHLVERTAADHLVQASAADGAATSRLQALFGVKTCLVPG